MRIKLTSIIMIMAILIPALGHAHTTFAFEKTGVCTMNVKLTATKEGTVYYKNMTNSAITIQWKITSNSLPAEWDYSLCDNGQCYISVPSSSETGTIQPGERGFFILAINPQNITGKGELVLQLTDKNDPSSTATLQFLVTAGEPSAIVELDEEDELMLYPNPAGSVLHVELPENPVQTTLSIYSADGKEVIKTDAIDIRGGVSVANLHSGIYLVSLRDEKGQVAMAKFIKQ